MNLSCMSALRNATTLCPSQIFDSMYLYQHHFPQVEMMIDNGM